MQQGVTLGDRFQVFIHLSVDPSICQQFTLKCVFLQHDSLEECQTLHSSCPKHTLQAWIVTRWPWPTFHASVTLIIGLLSVKLYFFSYPSILTCVLGAQKNRLIETVLLSPHNICLDMHSYLEACLILGRCNTAFVEPMYSSGKVTSAIIFFH